MVYKKEKDRMIITQTKVDEPMRGKNIGFELIKHGVEYARETNLKIVTLCSFAKKINEGYKEFHDVLPR